MFKQMKKVAVGTLLGGFLIAQSCSDVQQPIQDNSRTGSILSSGVMNWENYFSHLDTSNISAYMNFNHRTYNTFAGGSSFDGTAQDVNALFWNNSGLQYIGEVYVNDINLSVNSGDNYYTQIIGSDSLNLQFGGNVNRITILDKVAGQIDIDTLALPTPIVCSTIQRNDTIRISQGATVSWTPDNSNVTSVVWLKLLSDSTGTPRPAGFVSTIHTDASGTIQIPAMPANTFQGPARLTLERRSLRTVTVNGWRKALILAKTYHEIDVVIAD